MSAQTIRAIVFPFQQTAQPTTISQPSIMKLPLFAAAGVCAGLRASLRVGLSVSLSASLLVSHAHAQAPIQDRSDPGHSVEGARFAAKSAHDARAQAEQRARETEKALGIATEQHKLAQQNLEAARAARAAALQSVSTARRAEVEANAALARILKK